MHETSGTVGAGQIKLVIDTAFYHEKKVLPKTYRRLVTLVDGLVEAETISKQSKKYFVDDGSRDETWSVICRIAEKASNVVGIRFSRNYGHQSALLAGLPSAEGDAVISIDANLQDDINVIPKMVSRFRDGCDIVYGVRDRRDTDTVFKRGTASFYYKILGSLGVDIIPNHTDFRLLSRRAFDNLRKFDEVNLFLRGLVPMLGFSTASVQYYRTERFAGETKYPFHRMLALALDSIISFSTVTPRAIAVLGLVVSVLTIELITWALWIRLFTDQAFPGWASSVLPVYFLGGIQLLSVGVVGEYVAKMYLETKRRPRYLIREIIGGR